MYPILRIVVFEGIVLVARSFGVGLEFRLSQDALTLIPYMNQTPKETSYTFHLLIYYSV